MNSNVADVNISALLNLGVKPSSKEFEGKVGGKEDSFDRHLSEQAQKQNRSSADSTPVKESQTAAASQTASNDSTSDRESDADNKALNDDVQGGATDNSQSGEEASQESSTPTEGDDRSDSETESVTPASDPSGRDSAAGDDLAPLVSESLVEEEVLVDVPADASISLENIVKAVSSATDPQSPEAESVDAVLDDLVDSIVPVTNAPTTAAAASQTTEIKTMASGQPRSQGASLSAGGQAGSTTDSEGLELPEMPSVDPKLVATKASDAQVAQAAQLPSTATSKASSALAATVANAVDAVVKETASAKGEGTSSAREASPLVAISQRSGTRPLNVQQGNAQFTMPTQAKAGQPQWQTAVAERVAVMASQRITSAEIQLDPPELGQLQVRVTLNQEQASVSFASQHAVVREALDQTAHRLRDMFDAEGLDLVDVDVSDQSFHQEQGESNGGEDGFAASDEASAEPELVKVSQGLVDHFV